MPVGNPKSSELLIISELLFLSFAAFSFYLLVTSRTAAAQTVWQALHPAFIPTLFVATFLLLTILFTSEKTTHKMMLIIVYSILVHSLFSIIFPAGDLSGQQMVLGETRRVFDNTILHGLSGWPTATLQIFIVEAFKGINLQATLTTIFARMLSMDIFYVHLFFIPTLWGVFIPIGAFSITKIISGNEKTATLSSLLVAAFPYTIYFGAISVPNSLGFIFFLYSVYFMLKYLSGNDSKTVYLMVVFSLFSFLSHYLTGIMSFSLLLLTMTFKTCENGESSSSTDARILLTISFITSAILLPVSFIYLRYFGTSSNPIFTPDKLYEIPVQETIGLFLIGDLIYSLDLRTVLLNVTGPFIALLCMMCFLYYLRRDPNAKLRTQIYFLFSAYLIFIIDYGITKVFMEGLPLNVERLWVLRDFLAVPFVAITVHAVVSSLQSFLRARSPKTSLSDLQATSKPNTRWVLALTLAVNIVIAALVAGWITLSLTAAYPHVAALQTTSYELEAVRYIESNTHENYVVIGDVWTTYAGEVVVGVSNPRAYYYAPFNPTGYDLFVNMKQDPSPHWMLLAMNYTATTVAYFIVTEPRLGAEAFNDVVSRTFENGQLSLAGIFGDEKLYVFSYRKE